MYLEDAYSRGSKKCKDLKGGGGHIVCSKNIK